ncbi:MAG: RHS repeat-associated core domain-containing protein [Candidatus Eremiobacteraeota bacterium]|nr:RHS repeat-associated core domain-containing protein [Candidatus Eremiobacteraeota bacterium]
MIPALLGLIAPVTAVKVFTQLARAAGAALRSATAPVVLPVPPIVEKAAGVSEQISQSPVIFAYDGMSRRTKITEYIDGTMTSKKLYWWLGGSIVCERDGLQTGFPITRRFFGQGEVRGTTKLYYAMDHLGSVRELVDSAGAVRAEYSYSTYGERNKETGDLESEWGYGGLWHHAPSGLDLATYRLYDAANKRWISRDPLGEGADRTLYSYCFNSPVNFVDPAGLDGLPAGFTMTSSGGVNSYSNNDLSNGPRYTGPDTWTVPPGSRVSGSNGVTGGRPGPVGGSGHTRPGEGGTAWENSVYNMYRDGNAASASHVYTGAEEVLLMSIPPEVVFLGATMATTDDLGIPYGYEVATWMLRLARSVELSRLGLRRSKRL